VDLADAAQAQKLADQQLRTDWKGLLNRLVWQVHPAHHELFGEQEFSYYWSALETEWATDVLFRSPQTLAALFPTFQRYAMTQFGSQDVLRLLGRCPQVRRYKTSEITTSLKTREEGTRVRHSLNANSVKMYDKQGSVLRVETAINRPGEMKVFRHKEGQPRAPRSWQRLRKGVADLHRRAEIRQKSNARYLEAPVTWRHWLPRSIPSPWAIRCVPSAGPPIGKGVASAPCSRWNLTTWTCSRRSTGASSFSTGSAIGISAWPCMAPTAFPRSKSNDNRPRSRASYVSCVPTN
jgi:hypothetical protein